MTGDLFGFDPPSERTAGAISLAPVLRRESGGAGRLNGGAANSEWET